MVYKGSGGPPPGSEGSGSGGGGNKKPYGFAFYEKITELGPKRQRRRLPLFWLKKGTGDVVMILDEAPPSDEHHPSILLHEFKFRGGFGHHLVCISHQPEGCLMDVALQEKHTHAPWCKTGDDVPEEDRCQREGQMENRKGGWRWIATGIQFSGFTFKNGPDKGKTLECQRVLIAATKEQYEMLQTYRKAWGSLRGRIFQVTREDKKKSPKIGGKWDPLDEHDFNGVKLTSPATDEQMMEAFENEATIYGLKIEDYIAAADYEDVLKELSVAEMNKAARWVAEEQGVSLTGHSSDDGSTNDGSSATEDAEAEEEDAETIPF